MFENWSWTTLILLWTIANCGPMWFTIYINQKFKPDQSRDEKFKPFVRTDLRQWSYILTIFTHFFYLPRLFIGWSSIMFAFIGCAIASIGHDRT